MTFGVLSIFAIIGMIFIFVDTGEDVILAPEGLIIGMLCIITISVFYYLIDTFRLQRSLNWVKTTGTVSSIRLDEEGKGNRIKINYYYTVSGTKFTGSNFSLSEEFASKIKIKRLTGISADMLKSKAVIGHRVAIYYNPGLYGESALSKKAQPSICLTQLPGYAVIFVCMYYISRLIFEIINKSEISGFSELLEKFTGFFY